MIVINNEKTKAIVFIHGFYANAAFWLNYIEIFKDYKLIFLNIDFLNFESIDFEKSKLILKSEKINLEIIAVISHSLGTIISNYFSNSDKTLQFDICPIGFGESINKYKFVEAIAFKTQQSQELILQDLLKIEQRYNNFDFYKKSEKKILYVPDSDTHFKYFSSTSPKIFFSGDHFNIENALKGIKTYLISNKI